MKSDAEPSKHPIPEAVKRLLRNVLRSGVTDRARLRACVRQASRVQRDDVELLVRHFVRMGLLSRFQAQKIQQGVTRGLALGPYQILAPLGKGGMSTVYLARDERSRQLVAVKILSARKVLEGGRMRTRFRREMELGPRLTHPHIARPLEAGEIGNVCYIAMEFVAGGSLHRLVKREGPLAVPRAARLLAETAAALEHAHAQRLVHRDLKPANIGITADGHAKVLDFGLAMTPGEQADPDIIGGKGYAVGTMDFIAPEQASNAAKIDERADLYSLGCSLYFALAGRAPFPGGSKMDKIRRHRLVFPEPLGVIRPDLSPAFEMVVSKLMAKRPEQRYQTAAEARRALLAWVTGERPRVDPRP